MDKLNLVASASFPTDDSTSMSDVSNPVFDDNEPSINVNITEKQ